MLATRYSPVPECRPIVTQLCMALSSLAAKMEGWSCETIIRDIHSALRSSAPLALAETLRVLPEEVESKALSIHPDRRAQVRFALQASTSRALDVLDELWIQAEDCRLAVAVLQATACWTDYAPRELRPVTSKVSLEALVFFAAPPMVALSSGAQVVAQHPDGTSALVAAACATVTSHAQAGVGGAQPLLELLQPLLQALQHQSVKTEAQLDIISHAAGTLLEATVAATAAQGLISALLQQLAARGPLPFDDGTDDHDQHSVASLPALQPFVCARDFWDADVQPEVEGGRKERRRGDKGKGKREGADAAAAAKAGVISGGCGHSSVQVTKEMRRAALAEALLPVTQMLSAVVGLMMAFPSGQWQEAWEFEAEAPVSQSMHREGLTGLLEREGTNRHVHIKSRDHLADVMRDTVTVTGVHGLNLIMTECRARLHTMVSQQPGGGSECQGAGWELMEGYLYALYAVSKEYAKCVEAGLAVDWGVDDLVSCLSLLARGGSQGAHPRMLETQLWILSSLAPVLCQGSHAAPSAALSPTPPSHSHTHLSSQQSPPFLSASGSPSCTPALVRALELTYASLDSSRPATARGAAVAWMKIAEKGASSIVGLGTEAYAKPLDVFRTGACDPITDRLLLNCMPSPPSSCVTD